MLLIAGLAVALAANLFARGVGVGIQAYRAEWIWRPLARAIPVNLLPAALVAAVLTLLVWVLCRDGRWEATSPFGRALALFALVLVVFALQTVMINAVGEPWVAPGAIIASPVSTTYFAISRDVHSVRDYLGNYHQIMPRLPYHAATHPPGITLFFLAIRRACAALTPASAVSSAVVAKVQFYADKLGVGFPPEDAVAAIASALLLALAGSASLIPIYFFARQLATPQAALCAACLAASIPSLLLLPVSSDQLVLLLSAVTVWLAYAAWRSGGPLLSLLSGLCFALGLFVTLGFATVGVWLALWGVIGVLRAAERGETARRFASRAAIALCGFAAFYLALFLTTGYRAWAVAYAGLFAHRQATTVEFPRTYWKWVLMNPVEMAVFAGLALVIAALWAAPAVRNIESRPLRLFLLSWLIVLVVLDVSGTVRAEVGRIWLFLMWPLALAAGERLSRAPRYAAALALLALMQLGQALVMRGYLTMYDIF